MPFEAGKSGNPKGRKAGSSNKCTKDIKDTIGKIIDENFTPFKIRKDLKNLNEKDRMNFFIKLLEYVAPKMKSSEDSNEVKTYESVFNEFVNNSYNQLKKSGAEQRNQNSQFPND